MRIRTSTAITGFALAAGLTAAGCSSASSGSSSTAASATAASASASPAASASSSPVASTSAAPVTSPTGPAPSSSPAFSGSAPAAASICQPANLSFTLGAGSGGTGQRTLAVNLANTGSSACTMTGFPGVDLVGAANGNQDYRWSLRRSSTRYATVTVKPGHAAHFDLTYLPGVAGDGTNLTVFKMIITPPGAFTQAQVSWHQSVLLQDAATRPGTYISPVAAGS